MAGAEPVSHVERRARLGSESLQLISHLVRVVPECGRLDLPVMAMPAKQDTRRDQVAGQPSEGLRPKAREYARLKAAALP